MKFNPSFTLRDVCGEKVLIASGVENIDFGALINLNPTAADIYTHFVEKEFTLDDVVAYLTAEYDVAADVARCDAEMLLKTMSDNGVVA